ncbi:AI-2E family transporter [Bdellovibrio sp. HCB337]|uniref:AI-2E family transporter n=1 Tax=Bdellovibrio sp. HCB337 TaxID=3394358 RepID=UPI0039A4C1F1
MTSDKEKIFRVLAILVGILGSAYVLSPFLADILLAGVVAYALNPWIHKITKTRWCRHSLCLYGLTFGLFLIISIPFLGAISKIYGKLLAIDLTDDGKKAILTGWQEQRKHVIDTITHFFSQFGLRSTVNIDAMMTDATQKLLGAGFRLSTYIVTQIPDVLFSFVVFLVMLFLFMRHAGWMERTFRSAELLNSEETTNVITVLKETSYSSIFSSILTGMIQSTIVTTGAAIFLEVDLGLVFIVTFICSFIPVIGAAPIAFTLAIYGWIIEDTTAGIGLVIVGIVAGIADNIARVYMLKIAKDKLHPFWSLLAIIGGIMVLGLPGLFLGPVIVSATMQIAPMLLNSQSKR